MYGSGFRVRALGLSALRAEDVWKGITVLAHIIHGIKYSTFIEQEAVMVWKLVCNVGWYCTEP